LDRGWWDRDFDKGQKILMGMMQAGIKIGQEMDLELIVVENESDDIREASKRPSRFSGFSSGIPTHKKGSRKLKM